MNMALVMVDIQNDYFQGGRFPLMGPETAAENALKMLAYFRQRRQPVIHVQHISLKPDAAFFLPATEGADFYSLTAPVPGEKVIIKHKPDSFLETVLELELRAGGIGKLMICGMMTHMCIDTTVRSAAARGYAVTLISDACATRALVWNGTEVSAEQVQYAYLAALHGTFARVQGAETWIAENERS